MQKTKTIILLSDTKYPFFSFPPFLYLPARPLPLVQVKDPFPEPFPGCGGCNFEELCNGSKLSYACDNVIDITRGNPTVQEAEQELLDHLYRCIRRIERGRELEVEKFYIGKTYVRQKTGAQFDHMDSSTWRLDNGINGRWNVHKDTDYGRDGLVVLTVVTRDAIHPDIQENNPDFHEEKYALVLERRLILDCMIDSRLENKTLESGKRDSARSICYALYIAFKVSMLFSNSYLIV